MGDAAAVQFGPQPLPCAVDLPRALRYLGQRREGLPEHLEQRLQEAADQCASAARPRGVGRAYPLLWGGPGRPVKLAGTGVALPGADIARFLEGCTHAVVLAVTLGMESERQLARAQALSPLEGLLADGCASSMAEEAARAASAEIERRARVAGFRPTKRFSAGYGDLPLQLQPDMLRLSCGDKLLGIHVGPSLLMTPMKSVTAVVGLAPLAGPKARDTERR